MNCCVCRVFCSCVLVYVCLSSVVCFARELSCDDVWFVVLLCLCSFVCSVVFNACASFVLHCVMPCGVYLFLQCWGSV